MQIRVRVLVDDAASQGPAPGAEIVVELRDTTLADAPSDVVAVARTTIVRGSDDVVAAAVLDVDPARLPERARLTLSAEVGGGRDALPPSGHWITTAAVPWDRTAPSAAVTLHRIA